jgi:hypothetical protein
VLTPQVIDVVVINVHVHYMGKEVRTKCRKGLKRTPK